MVRDAQDPSLEATTRAPIEFGRTGHVAVLTLNRPDKLNAIDGTCLTLLREAVESIESDAGIRAVVVTGRGRAFCAGADLDYVAERLTSAAAFAEFIAEWHETLRALEQCSKPTIAAVHGVALAGGLELTQVCDVVVAAADATFGDQHAKLGLFPGGGSTQRLPRLIGQRRARWLLLSGEHFGAEDARQFGMVTHVVAPDDLQSKARALAEQLSRSSASANRAIKHAAMAGADLPLDQALSLERALAVEHMLGLDARAGIQAFREKRQPVFSGLDLGDVQSDA